MKTLDRLRNNYNLTRWLVWLLYVVSFAFAKWHECVSSVIIVNSTEMLGMDSSYLLVVLVAFLSGIVALLVANLLASVFMNFARMYYLPKHEFILVFVFFLAVNNGILGLLNCLYFITPVIAVWGSKIFPFVAITISMFMFYRAVSKLYLNSKTAPIFARTVLILFSVYNAVILLSGLLTEVSA